ncbi:MAG: DUF2341 domain-containing protein [Patescibacteria group bacterium]
MKKKIIKIIKFITIIIIIIIIAFSVIKPSPKKASVPQLSPAPPTTSYLYQNISKDFAVYLGDRLQENKPKVKFEQEDSSAEFSPAEFGNPPPRCLSAEGGASSTSEVNCSSLLYKDIQPGIDIKYSLNDKGIKEEIILSNQQSSNLAIKQFRFALNLKNAVPRKSLDGRVSTYFIDTQDGQYRFHIPKPFMVDAAGARSTEVELRVVSRSSLSGSTSYEIIISPSSDWLSHPARQYPVIIDPSVVHDTSSEFSTGTFNRISDAGSGSSPKLELPYHELAADIRTVGLWHMNESSGTTTVADSSGNSNTGTSASSTNVTTGKFGNARSFNGSSDYISFSDSSSLKPTSAVTVEAWVKPTNFTCTGADTNCAIFSKYGGNWIGYKLEVTSSGIPFFNICTPSTCPSATSTVALPSGTWSHLAGTWDGSSIKIYINGILTGTGTASALSQDTTAPTIGKASWYSGDYFNGVIDEVRISDIARTPEEIRQDAQRFPYGIHTSDSIDLTSGTSKVTSLDSLSWSDTASSSASLPGWSNYKPVIIDNTQNSNTLTNYQVKVNVDYDSNMQTDFDDLRFTNSSGTSLDYWIEDKADGAWAKVWVEVDSITASSFTTIFMWYGNSGASTGSNGSATFPFWDNFEDGDVSDWTVLNPTAGTWSASTEQAKRGSYSGKLVQTNSVDTSITAYKAFTTPNIYLTFDMYDDSDTTAFKVIRLYDGTNTVGIGVWTDSSSTNYVYHNTAFTYTATTVARTTGWHKFAIRMKSTGEITFFIDGNQVGTLTGQITTITQIRVQGYWGGTTTFYVDDLRVHQYSSPEPVAGVGADVEFQTRTSADNSTWEEWRPITNETAIASMDSDATNWSTSSTTMLTKTDESTIKMEGTGSLKSTVGAPQTDANTRGLWHLEETGGSSAYIQDETSLNNDLTPTGATVTNSGFFSSAREFSGSSQYLSCTDGNCGGTTKLDYTGSGGWTVGAWVYPHANTDADHSIVTKGGDSGQYGYYLYVCGACSGSADGSLDFLVSSNGTALAGVSGTSAVPTYQWHLAVGVYDGSALKIYLDGALIGTTSYSSGIFDNTGSFGIGASMTSTPASFFDGIIDEPFVKATAMTAEEIAEAYRAGRDHRLQKTISSTDLSGKTKVPFYFAADRQGTIAETYIGETDHSVYGTDTNTRGLWHLDDQSTNLDDSSANNNDGTSYNSLRTVYSMTASGNSYAYIDLTGVADYVIQSGDYLEYDIYWTASLDKIAFDYTTSDGATLRDAGVVDQNNLNAHPNTDLDAKALGKWYHRKIALPSGHVGKTITYFDVACEDDTTSTRTGYFDAIAITNGSGTIRKVIYNAGSLSYANHLISNGSLTSLGNYAGPEHTITQGKIGNGRYFNGLNDYIGLPDIGVTEGTAYTVEFWAKAELGVFTTAPVVYSEGTPANWSNNLFIIYYGDNPSTNGGIRVWYRDSGGTGGSIITYSQSVSDGLWHHVAFVQSSASDRKLYLDSNQIGSDTTSRNALVVTNASIGAANNNGSMTQFYKGIIDEVRISNTARTPEEIRLAYQYSLRTHQVNVDFVTTAGSDGPTSTSDTQFTPDSTTGLYKGDTVIVRENYNGTLYIMQGEVSSISSGLVTVSSWSGTAPSGGYSTDADVFKWQREYWDIGDVSVADRNAIVRLGLRILDASEGFTMYLDDFRSNTNYLTTPGGSTISSTANRYIQYRAILSTNDTQVSPQLTSVTINYTINNRPNTPSLDSPTNAATNVSLTPALKTTATDTESDYLRYKIQVCTDSGMTQNCQTFDQTSSQTGWSGQNTQGGTAYTSGTQATYTVQSALSPLTTYYWRSYAIDPGGSNIWSTTQSPVYSFTTASFYPPTGCLIDDSGQPSQLIVKWQDNTAVETGYRIEKNTDSGGFTFLIDKAIDSTSHTDTNVSSGHTYQYRVRAEVSGGSSDWCMTQTVNLATGDMNISGVTVEGMTIK